MSQTPRCVVRQGATPAARSVLLGAALLVAAPAPAQDGASVFSTEAPLALTVRTDMRALLRDRGEEREEHQAVLHYAGRTGAPDSIAGELRTRGNFRRRQSICPFPPLRLDIRPRDARGTMFAGERRFKLVTHCRSNDLYEQYVLQEYLIYRIYALLTDLSLRTRLGRITYEDVSGREDPVTRYAFLIEREERLADRHGMRVVEDTGAPMARLDPQHTVFVAVFQYFIGNTDWSVRALHNIILLADSAGRLFPVPYDFDWSGAIATRYARPDTSLHIRSVEQRLYAGYCGSPEEFEQVFGKFRRNRAAIEALYELEGLDRGHRERALKYYDAFFRMIDDPRRVRSEMLGRCPS